MTNWTRRFFVIWTGQAFSLVGSMLVQFALVWWLTERTGSATVLALATLVGMLPGIVISPFSGALVDRWSRRAVMIVADGGIALATLALALIYLSGQMQTWHVLALMFVRGVGGGFQWAAMQASTSLMVPHAHLSRVAGMNQTLQGVMSIVTPPLGALLLALMPLPAILAIDVSTAMLAIGPLFFYSIPQPERASAGAPATWRGVLGDVAAGFRLIWNWRWLRTIALGCAVANLVLNPAYSLTPLVVTAHFGGGAPELGWMNAALGSGTVVGGVVLSAWGGFRRRIRTMMLGVVFLAAGPLIVGLAPEGWLWMAVAGMWLGGVGGPIFNGPLMALLQTTVEPEMQGRVLTATNSMYSLASPLGLAIAGPVADLVGPQMWFVLAGLTCIVVGLAVVRAPGMWTMDETDLAQAQAMGRTMGE